MKEKEKLLIKYLIDKNSWIKAEELSLLLDVSTRQIRNYIASINSEWQNLIVSSQNGYKIQISVFNDSQLTTKMIEKPDLNVQVRMILKIITQKNGISIEEITEEFYLGFLTVETYLNQVRKELDGFGLKLKRRKNIVSIIGKESNKRRLIHKIFRDSTTNYSFMEGVELILDIQMDILAFQQEIKNIIVENKLFINDYALTNITVHLLIAIDRSKKMSRLENIDYQKHDSNNQSLFHHVALDIINYINDFTGISIMDDFSALQTALRCSTNSFDYKNMTTHNIFQYVDKKYLTIAEELIKKVNNTFYLSIKIDDFIPSFSLHIQNLFQRSLFGYNAQNPLTHIIKSSYPLVYDIAVYLAQILINEHQITMTEDEIAYLAIHIGGHLEASNLYRGKVKAVFVYMEYYDLHINAINRLQEDLDSFLYFAEAIPKHSFNPEEYQEYLIITSVALDVYEPYSVIEVTPFIKDENIKQIKTVCKQIKLKKQQEKAKKIIYQFFKKDLFFTEVYKDNEAEYIQFLSKKAQLNNLVGKGFAFEVIQREMLSSTSYINGVAVPHNLTLSANRSFIATILNKESSSWATHKVKLILLVGINKEDGRDFRIVFDYLIEQLIDPIKLGTLLNSKDFDDFIKTLVSFEI